MIQTCCTADILHLRYVRVRFVRDYHAARNILCCRPQHPNRNDTERRASELRNPERDD